ncbi:MAG: alpha-2-macroglobulin, partial [Maribacter sp.]|nr:alpha-2-macroglobulin [Maribacter sp.]
KPQYYDTFDWFGLHFGYGYGLFKERRMMKSEAPMAAMDKVEGEALEETVIVDNDLVGNGAGIEKTNTPGEESRQDEDPGDVQIRKNFQETAFFFPQLQTDREGNVSFSFTTPEALTKWKLQLLAHTKTLQSTVSTLETMTHKELMVIPNAPRFVREGDEIVLSTKIANLTKKSLSGFAQLELTDALTGILVSHKLLNDPVNNPKNEIDYSGRKSFEVDSMGNIQVSWRLKIPSDIQTLQYKIVARAGDFSDGEQNVLPVLTNRLLVTETLPMWVRTNQTKTYVLDKLKDNTSTTLKHHKLTLEITSNPAWYAVQALPYLMEFPHDCNEQIFSRYYANSLASHIANGNPRIQEVFNQWANSDALLSNLEKNQEFKSLLIQETPWLRDAQSETEQKKRIALLFNLNTLKNEQSKALHKLIQNQMSSGAWAWFKGGRANRFMTQHIIAGLGHLNHLKVKSDGVEMQNDIIEKAIGYLDGEFVNEYDRMKKYAQKINDDHLSYSQMHYLYMRSLFPEIKTSKKVDAILNYYKGQAKKYWTKRSLYAKGMLALVLFRMDDHNTANKILKSLKENSIVSDEMGMYWKENTGSWYWYQAPIETQALLIEAFAEIGNDTTVTDNLKIWLLKNKQTNRWKTTKATTEAIYALLLQGSDWLSVTDAVAILVGGEKIEPFKLENVKIEAGTGYYKTSWNKTEVTPKRAAVQLNKKGQGVAWGALYWQYFEDLDKITSAETPIKLRKKLFLRRYTQTGEEISEINNKTKLALGDLVRVRIEIKVDRPMEYVHMKDMRASGLEPVNVLSQYKWQDGLGYYESTKDASTNFFFDYLPKGVFVFEYDLRINNSGDFSNGITTIQSMYAPEFSSHSEGIRVKID